LDLKNATIVILLSRIPSSNSSTRPLKLLSSVHVNGANILDDLHYYGFKTGLMEGGMSKNLT